MCVDGKRFGMHMRIRNNLRDVIEVAKKYNVANVQCFLLNGSGSYFEIDTDQFDEFKAFAQTCNTLFLHASYYVNLVNFSHKSKQRSFYECLNAWRLGFTHVVFHPGAHFSSMTRKQALRNVARHVLWLLSQIDDLVFVLENVATKGRSMGGDLHELYEIYKKVGFHPRVKFCFDTAHAYAYGYDLLSEKGYADCVATLQAFGQDAWVLVHANETRRHTGSKIDQHAQLLHGHLGEVIGKIIHEPMLQDCVVLTELSGKLSTESHDRNIQVLAQWINKDR